MESSIRSSRFFAVAAERPRCVREPYKRSRVLSGAALMALGFMSLSIALIVMIAHKSGNYDNYYSASGSYAKQVAWHHDDMHYLSAWTCLSASAMGAGMLLIAGRYSLRWMLGLLAFSGFAGAVPAMQTRAPQATMSVRLQLPFPLSAGAVKNIEKKLQPAAAMATMPVELRTSENLAPGRGVQRVAAYADAGGAFVMEVDADPALSTEQRQVLLDFYADYAEVLAVSEVVNGGVSLTSTSLFCFNDGGPWTQWRGVWLKSLPNVPAVMLAVLPNVPGPSTTTTVFSKR
jgi:hypothetical protein